MKNTWVSAYRSTPSTQYRLFCFPYAGASGVVYSKWARLLPSGVEVCAIELPGRSSRIREPPISRLAPLVSALADGMSPLLSSAFGFYGHSFGALIAFEVARELRRRKLNTPNFLICGASRAPHVALDRPHFHHLSDEELLAASARHYGATIDHRILEVEEIRQMIVAAMRADLAVAESYLYYEDQPLEIPISVVAGRSDGSTSEASLRAWAQHTEATCDLTYLEGGHLFLNHHVTDLLKLVSSAITSPHAVSVAPGGFAKTPRRSL